MKKKDRNIKFSCFRTALVIFGLAIFLLSPCLSFAQDDVTRDRYGLQETANKTALSSMPISKGAPEDLAAQIVNNVLLFVGTIFFLIILYAGISWMTARGQSEKVNKAKGILETAIIGLIIVAASYAISTFIFSRLATTAGGGGGGVLYCRYAVESEPICQQITDSAEDVDLCMNTMGGLASGDPCPEE